MLFWKAMGPGEIDAKDREKFFQMLGIPPLPEKGDYFVDWSHFAMLHRSEFKGSTEDADAAERESRRQFDIIRERPWSKQEFPVWAKWVEENEKSRATLIEATKRPRCYEPLMGDMVIASLLPDLQQFARSPGSWSRTRCIGWTRARPTRRGKTCWPVIGWPGWSGRARH